LVRDDPGQLGAVATRFDAELELGRVDAARADIERLAEAGGPAVTIRLARLASVTGDPAGALELARNALAGAEADDLEDTTFYHYAVGEYGRLAGDPVAAREAYRVVLQARGDDPAALLGLARIDANEGRLVEAIISLRTATAVIPQPESLALLGDLQASTGDPAASATYDTVRFIGRLGEVQAATYDRQLLRFELDHDGSTPALLDAAKSSFDRQPGAAAHDLVAWALYRLGRFDEAAEQIAAARTLGADDARLRFHGGAIELSRGNEATGRALLESALALGPALDPIERTEAERLLG
ncbi:MAG: tetratricopeptide repeat protein, partial [Candidatus Limnocylindrales bacterium]